MGLNLAKQCLLKPGTDRPALPADVVNRIMAWAPSQYMLTQLLSSQQACNDLVPRIAVLLSTDRVHPRSLPSSPMQGEAPGDAETAPGAVETAPGAAETAPVTVEAATSEEKKAAPARRSCYSGVDETETARMVALMAIRCTIYNSATGLRALLDRNAPKPVHAMALFNHVFKHKHIECAQVLAPYACLDRNHMRYIEGALKMLSTPLFNIILPYIPPGFYRSNTLVALAARCGAMDCVRTLIVEYGGNARADNDAALIEACGVRGDVGVVRLCLERGADVNANEGAPLGAALDSGREDVLAVLIEAGVMVEEDHVVMGLTANPPGIMRMLIDHAFGDSAPEDLEAVGALGAAVEACNVEMVDLLIRVYRQSLSEIDRQDLTVAAESDGFDELLVVLLEAGLDPAVHDYVIPVVAASRSDAIDILGVLTDAEKTQTPLNLRFDNDRLMTIVCEYADIAFYDYLAGQGCDPRSCNGRALKSACTFHVQRNFGMPDVRIEFIQHLLDRGFNLEPYIETAWVSLATSRHEESLQRTGYDGLLDMDLVTPTAVAAALDAAAKQDRSWDVTYLIERCGADPNAGGGGRLLRKAIRNGARSAVMALLSHGADPTADGGAALLDMVSGAMRPFFQELLIKTTTLSPEEKTLYVRVVLGHYEALESILDQYAGLVHAREELLLRLAVSAGRGMVVQMLLARGGANVRACDNGAVCCLNVSHHSMRLLLMAGADANARDGTPLVRAAEGGDAAMVELLLAYGAEAHRRAGLALAVAILNDHPYTAERLRAAGAVLPTEDRDALIATVNAASESGVLIEWKSVAQEE